MHPAGRSGVDKLMSSGILQTFRSENHKFGDGGFGVDERGW